MNRCANKNASENARKLLDYLHDIQGKGIISGQHTQTEGMEEIAYILAKTGRVPKLRGFELLSYSGNINFTDSSDECLKEVYQNQGTLKKAYDYGMSNLGFLTFTFHWFSPLYGHDKSFYSNNTSFDPRQVLNQGSKERTAFFRDLDKLARELQLFAMDDIPILWRPFHEADGDWFWWGNKGVETAVELYKLMFDYFVNEKHLNNLLWVWNAVKAYPGDDYVDVVSIDIYPEKAEKSDYWKEYLQLIKNTSRSKVAAIGELSYLPDIDLLQETKIPWTYFMCWSKEFCMSEKYNSNKDLLKFYSSDYVIKE